MRLNTYGFNVQVDRFDEDLDALHLGRSCGELEGDDAAEMGFLDMDPKTYKNDDTHAASSINSIVATWHSASMKTQVTCN